MDGFVVFVVFLGIIAFGRVIYEFRKAGKFSNDLAIIFDESGNGNLATPKKLGGCWFVSRTGGSFYQGNASSLNEDGSLTGGAYIKSWARVSGMDGFGPDLKSLQSPSPPKDQGHE